MKTTALFQKLFSLQFVLVLLIAISFTSCNDNGTEPEPEKKFSEEIVRTVPQETIEQIRKMGVTVNEGVKPPLLDGNFWLSPNVMTKTDVPNDSYKPGYIFDDYKIRLYNQDTKKLTISLDSKSFDTKGNLTSVSVGENGAYLSGSGNNFTIFVITEGEFTYNHSRYKMLEVYSGEKTANGIKNFENAIVMLDDYGDINDDLIEVNTGRAFKDQDGFSESSGTFRIEQTGSGRDNNQPARLREQFLVKK